MTKKQKRKKPPPKKEPPSEKKSPYARDQDLRLMLPKQFQLLCKLAEVTPHELLDRFMNDLGQESWKRRENDAVRKALIDYFILCGYGQKWYSEADLRQMFQELDAIGMLWPREAKMKMIDLHAGWRNTYQKYWFKKWWRKPRRKR